MEGWHEPPDVPAEMHAGNKEVANNMRFLNVRQVVYKNKNLT
jgi:hypothetical protein